MKTIESHYFSDLFDKVLYIFGTSPLSIIRSISILYTRSSHASSVNCLLAWSGWKASSRQHNWHAKYLLSVYIVEVLLMMDNGLIPNM